MTDLQTLKTRVGLRALIQEMHPLTKGSKTHCRWHEDHHPSLHIYPDGYFCFACGASGDHLDWLMATRTLSFQEAVEVLAYFAASAPTLTPVPSRTEYPAEKSTLEPLAPHQLETHKRRAAELREVPEALAGRGFTLADCNYLNVANENGNVIFPIVGPNGSALALKCRYAVKQALAAGALAVFLLEPWPVDACEVASAFGKPALRKRLTWSRKQPFFEPFGAIDAVSAENTAPKHLPSLSAKPDLVQWCSHSKGLLRWSGPKLIPISPPTRNANRPHAP